MGGGVREDRPASTSLTYPVSPHPLGRGLVQLQMITIIGIPFGIASFKLAGLALVPFGKTVVRAGVPLPPGTQVFLQV